MNQETAFDDRSLAVKNRARLIVALTALAAISAAVEIGVQYFSPRTIVYIFKPLTMVFIIVIALIRVCEFKGYRNLVVAFGSLAGDVFLMLLKLVLTRGCDRIRCNVSPRTHLLRSEDNGHLCLTLFRDRVDDGGVFLILVFAHQRANGNRPVLLNGVSSDLQPRLF